MAYLVSYKKRQESKFEKDKSQFMRLFGNVNDVIISLSSTVSSLNSIISNLFVKGIPSLVIHGYNNNVKIEYLFILIYIFVAK